MVTKKISNMPMCRWSWKVLEVPVAFVSLHRLSPGEKSMPIRVFITSDNGVSVRTHMYKEVEDPRTGEVRGGGERREGVTNWR